MTRHLAESIFALLACAGLFVVFLILALVMER